LAASAWQERWKALAVVEAELEAGAEEVAGPRAGQATIEVAGAGAAQSLHQLVVLIISFR